MEYITFISEKYPNMSVIIVIPLLVIVIIYISITRIPELVDAFQNLRYGNIKKLEKALENEDLNDEVKEAFKLLLAQNYFRKITGIKVLRRKREKFIQLYIDSQGVISFEELRKIHSLIDFCEDENKFVLNDNFRVMKNASSIGALICFILGLFMLSQVYFNIQEMEIYDLGYYHFLLVGIPALILSGLFFYLALKSIYSIEKVKIASNFIDKQDSLFMKDKSLDENLTPY